MRIHVIHCYPIEACGLLAGIDTNILSVMPVMNSLNSQTRFRMDAREQLACFLQIEKQNLELLGIYHSHPEGYPYPSNTDIDEAYYPEAAHIIWALEDHQWVCQAFHIINREVFPIELILEE